MEYEAYAETYWERIGATRRWGRYLSELEEREILATASRLDPGLVLEVGCDGGRWCAMLAGRGWRVCGTDVNGAGLAVARRRVPGGRFVEAADGALPAEDGAVRLLLVIQVPGATHSDWFPREAARVLEPGGAVVFSVNNRHSWRALKHNAPAEYPESFTSFRERLRQHGIDVVHARGACWFPFRRTSDSSLIEVATWLERATGLSAAARLSPLVIGRGYRAASAAPRTSAEICSM